MGREVRRVPKDWQHPKKKTFDYMRRCEVESYQPMFDRSFTEAMDEWYANWKKWEAGERPDYCSEDGKEMKFWEWEGAPPDPAYYMPEWPDAERTHLMMYEDTSEGTPISPAFETPEELARWCADNGASAFGNDTAPYEWWLSICKGSPSLGIMIAVAPAQAGT